MRPATRVNVIWYAVGATLSQAEPVATLQDDMPVRAYFRGVLRRNPERFDCSAEHHGFAPIRLSFRSVRPTVGLVVLHPYTLKDRVPDAVCLLVNGLEGEEDVAAVKAAVNFPPELWKLLDESEKARSSGRSTSTAECVTRPPRP